MVRVFKLTSLSCPAPLFAAHSCRDKGLSALCSCAHRHALAYVWKWAQYVWVYIWLCVRHTVIWVFNCLFVCALLWGFVDAWQHMFLLWLCVCVCLLMAGSVLLPSGHKYVSVHVCLHLGTIVRWCVHTWVFVHVLACLHAYVCIFVCLSEWALSGAAPCCASCIWNHLCWGSVGGERMTLMYLNPRQTFPRQSSVWNQDNWAQWSWTGWSGWWAWDRRFGYTVTPGQTH